MNIGKMFERIIEKHNTYRSRLQKIISLTEEEKPLQEKDKLDRVLFHIIEEIIEARRTYPHKFWKRSKEETDHEALLEELADVFLMYRSAYLEACKMCGVTEEQFLEVILKKVGVNNDRITSGY